MASDGPYAYRASAELAAALRAHRALVIEFDRRISDHNASQPEHKLMGYSGGFSSDPHFTGFADGTDEVPDGLSRAKSRAHLRPKKTKAGRPWQELLHDLNNNRPRLSAVLRAHDVPENAWGGAGPGGGTYISSTQWFDAGPDGAIVYNLHDLDGSTFGRTSQGGGRGPHLTAIPLSEFYRIKERIEGDQARETETSGGNR